MEKYYTTQEAADLIGVPYHRIEEHLHKVFPIMQGGRLFLTEHMLEQLKVRCSPEEVEARQRIIDADRQKQEAYQQELKRKSERERLAKQVVSKQAEMKALQEEVKAMKVRQCQ